MASWTNVRAVATLNAVRDECDQGAGAATLRIYSGTAPINVDTALASNTLLAQLTMSDPSFGSASDANPGATITASTITQDASADATGTASFFRILDSNGTAIVQGTVGTSGTELIVATTSFVAGAIVTCSSLVLTLAEI